MLFLNKLGRMNQFDDKDFKENGWTIKIFIVDLHIGQYTNYQLYFCYYSGEVYQ